MADTEDRKDGKSSSFRLDSLAGKKLPDDMLKKVSGGVDEYTQYYGTCPYCGGDTYYHLDHYGTWEVTCFSCYRTVDGAWMHK